MRAVWVATVDNMDWPSRAGLNAADQQRELIVILDRVADLRMNAVVFQVRTGADAFYNSGLEPWSEYLTGEMGRSPGYDPLAFAIEEAHKRGLELHAWINPYRARYSTKRMASPTHVSRAQPGLVRKYGSYLWMDPGDPAVRALTKRVVLDIVKRYDIDALHMDDYFYPYQEIRNRRVVPFPDDATYKRYTRDGGNLSRDDWRRRNVNLLVEETYDAIHREKPWVRFGISPFGIWRPGHPSSVRGLDQYAEIYADARKWWNEGWVDYLVPQLYWAMDRPQQSYVQLLRWWSDQNLKGRHLWAGNYTGKVSFTNSAAFTTSEILNQVSATRAEPGASGNVHFSMKVLLNNPDMLNERLKREAYASPALVPASPWLGGGLPSAPALVPRADQATGDRVVEIRPSRDARLWVIQTRDDRGWVTTIRPADSRFHTLPARTTDVRVRAVDRVGNLGAAGRVTFPR